ncbi:hypothetical protein [Dethiobacter alkaliphilus]|nr:hypothetical protein [Dethiobacter alkaliphilus]MCW3491531.1 hypothetical protein [Dethiobacter alkaliphilus]
MLYILVFLSLFIGINAYAKAQEAKAEIKSLRKQIEQDKKESDFQNDFM